MRILSLLVVFFWSQSVVAAATFVGQVQADFQVTERVDSTTTTANKTGALNITLTTDYTDMRWSMDFDVDLLLAGGPTQSFETRLAASGRLNSRRCPTCSLAGTGSPSPFSFPDANGRAGAGSYVLLGMVEWTLTDRIANVVRVRSSPGKAALWSGELDSFDSSMAYGYGQHYLSVLNYPASVQLSPGFYFGRSALQGESGQWGNVNGTSLGRITDDNNSVDVTLTSFPSPITLHELIPGDFNDSGKVDTADYVTWRNGSGVLSGFLSSYNVWRSNFGAELGMASAATAPEPATWLLLAASVVTISGLRRRFSQ